MELCLYPTTPWQCVDGLLTFSAGPSPCLPLLLQCCCCHCLRSPKPHHHDTFNVLCLGLQGTGKSTMLAALQGEGLEDTQPTKGEGEGTLEEGVALIEWSNIEEGQTVVCSSMFCDQLLINTANPQLSRLLILWTIVSASKSLYTSLQCFTRHSFSSHTMATVSVKEL